MGSMFGCWSKELLRSIERAELKPERTGHLFDHFRTCIAVVTTSLVDIHPIAIQRCVYRVLAGNVSPVTPLRAICDSESTPPLFQSCRRWLPPFLSIEHLLSLPSPVSLHQHYGKEWLSSRSFSSAFAAVATSIVDHLSNIQSTANPLATSGRDVIEGNWSNKTVNWDARYLQAIVPAQQTLVKHDSTVHFEVREYSLTPANLPTGFKGSSATKAVKLPELHPTLAYASDARPYPSSLEFLT
ncbi:hypothetical protein BDQ17DRAFT_1547950 [Cyathus striatus]|nr:hypothetical protein BDQ17DRAFT_1547950 [Cyathus striatus]